MPPWLTQQSIDIWNQAKAHLPTVALAVFVLVGGWVLALMLRRTIYSLLKKTTIDDRIAIFMGMETGGDFGSRVERLVATVIYYLALGAVLVVFFSVLRIDAIMQPLLTVLNKLGAAVPQIMKALLIGLGGVIIAYGARALVKRTLVAARFDERFASLEKDDAVAAAPADEPKSDKKEKRAKDKKADKADKRTDESKHVLATLMSNIAFWFVIVVTATPVLEALDIQVLSKPLQLAFERITEYLPKVGGAVIILVVGYVGARLLRRIVTSLLAQVGVDRAAEKLGVSKVLGGYAASRIAGGLTMAFVVLHAAISAVDKLDIAAVSGPASEVLRQIYGYLPKLFIGGLLMVVGVALARIIGNVVARIARSIGLHGFVAQLGFGTMGTAAAGAEEHVHGDDELTDLFVVRKEIRGPSDLLGTIAAAVVVLLFGKQVLTTLELAGLAQVFDRLLAFLPQLCLAVVIVAAGLWAGRWAKERIDQVTQNNTDRLMRSLGTLARGAISVVAVMMALQQLGVGEQLITVAFAVVLGSACLAAALAFGLGGRDAASRILERELERRQ